MARGRNVTNEPVAELGGRNDEQIQQSAPADNSGGGTGPDAGHGEYIIDPANVGGPGSASNGDGNRAGDGPKRRGRKPGSRNSPKAVPANIDAIEALLFSVHQMLAFGTGVPELAIEQAEAHSVAAAYVQVARHYPILQQSEKVLDWGGLLSALGMVYGTRLYAMRSKPRPQKAPQADNRPPKSAGERSNVINIPGVGFVDPTGLQ